MSLKITMPVNTFIKPLTFPPKIKLKNEILLQEELISGSFYKMYLYTFKLKQINLNLCLNLSKYKLRTYCETLCFYQILKDFEYLFLNKSYVSLDKYSEYITKFFNKYLEESLEHPERPKWRYKSFDIKNKPMRFRILNSLNRIIFKKRITNMVR